ncbi:MAG: hypothetical protein RLZZ299_1366 [Pseudomonadota bacterium]|jgi:hypothetical protein
MGSGKRARVRALGAAFGVGVAAWPGLAWAGADAGARATARAGAGFADAEDAAGGPTRLAAALLVPRYEAWVGAAGVDADAFQARIGAVDTRTGPVGASVSVGLSRTRHVPALAEQPGWRVPGADPRVLDRATDVELALGIPLGGTEEDPRRAGGIAVSVGWTARSRTPFGEDGAEGDTPSATPPPSADADAWRAAAGGSWLAHPTLVFAGGWATTGVSRGNALLGAAWRPTGGVGVHADGTVPLDAPGDARGALGVDAGGRLRVAGGLAWTGGAFRPATGLGLRGEGADVDYGVIATGSGVRHALDIRGRF